MFPYAFRFCLCCCNRWFISTSLFPRWFEMNQFMVLLLCTNYFYERLVNTSMQTDLRTVIHTTYENGTEYAKHIGPFDSISAKHGIKNYGFGADSIRSKKMS